MNDRAKLLAESLREAAIRAKEEDDLKAQIARVTAIAKPEIEKLLAQHKAETSKSLVCPHCNEPLPESWRTDDITSDSDSNDDPDNEQDDGDDELDAAGKSKVVAQLLANRKRRR